MGSNVWLLTAEGVLDQQGNPVGAPFGVASVAAGDARGGKIALVVDRHEVWVHQDDTWSKVASSEMTLNCVTWDADNQLVVGTEKARLARVTDGKLRFIESFDAVPERSLWKTPWGGPPDTRSLALASDGTLYANIHVGWIVRSKDGGSTWVNTREGLEMDVHQVAAHPTEPGIVFAATARGFHISQDHGETFQRQSDGMPYHYQRACARFPNEDVYLVTTSRGPHGQADARLYRSDDAGERWQLVQGLPADISANIDTFQVTALADGKALAVVENTQLYRSEDWGLHWTKIREDSPRVFGILAV